MRDKKRPKTNHDSDIEIPTKKQKCDDISKSSNSDNIFIEKYELKECFVDIDLKLPKLEEGASKDLLKNPIDGGRQICHICHKSISNTFIKKHLSSHRRTVECSECHKFFTEQGINHHTCYTNKLKLLPDTVICKICDKEVKKYNIPRHLRQHERSNKIIKKPKNNTPKIPRQKKYICEICGKDTKRKTHYDKHKRTHEKNKRFPCGECDEAFKYLNELVIHVSRIHRKIKEEEGFQCIFCKKVYLAIKHHLRTHQKCPFQCEKCGSILPNKTAYKSHLRYHQQLLHRGIDRVVVPRQKTNIEIIKPFKCDICSIRFKNDEELVNHYGLHTLNTEWYFCPDCEFQSSNSKTDVIYRTSIKNSSISNPSCPICSKVMQSKPIKRSIKYNEDLLFECELCSMKLCLSERKQHYRKFHKKFQKNSLVCLNKMRKKYSNPRTNLKKISCLICQCEIRVSHTRNHLKKHQEYKCTLCDKKFYQKDEFQLHQMNHKIEKEKRCIYCSQLFISHIRHLAHLKKVHQINFSYAQQCSKCIPQIQL